MTIYLKGGICFMAVFCGMRYSYLVFIVNSHVVCSKWSKWLNWTYEHVLLKKDSVEHELLIRLNWFNFYQVILFFVILQLLFIPPFCGVWELFLWRALPPSLSPFLRYTTSRLFLVLHAQLVLHLCISLRLFQLFPRTKTNTLFRLCSSITIKLAELSCLWVFQDYRGHGDSCWERDLLVSPILVACWFFHSLKPTACWCISVLLYPLQDANVFRNEASFLCLPVVPQN